MTDAAPVPLAPPRHQRATGSLDLVAGPGPRGAAIRDLHQVAPLRALFPRPEPDEVPMAALVNVAGGLAGGDALDIRVALEAGARLTVSTPAAEKVYRSLGPETRIATRLSVAAGAALEFIPQETILFARSRLHRALEADVAEGGRLLLADAVVFGRTAHGEVLEAGEFRDSWRLRAGGRLLWADGLHLSGDMAPLRAPFGFAGAEALATIALAVPAAAAHLPALRAMLEEAPAGVRAAATLPRPGLLLARLLGRALPVRRGLSAALLALRAPALGLPARLPRLWTS